MKGKTFGEALKKLLAGAMTGPFAEFINIPFNKKIGEITKSERQTLVNSLKNLRFEISGFRPIEEAVVTRGGVKVSEISPKTMESRLVPGLYFAGEIIDTDGYTGGFNLQIAFATGKLAGENCTF